MSPNSLNSEAPNREARYPCLFPGMIRVLFPEKSFIPLSAAVRVANISSGGALVEIHEGNLDENITSFEGCYFELRIATGGVPLIYGRVVRSDLEEDCCILGLRFHHSYPELIGRIVHEDAPQKANGLDPLKTPMLEPFAPITDEPILYVSGKAPGATQIELTDTQGDLTQIPVQDESFTLRLEMKTEDFNEFKIVSSDGARESSQLPIIIAYIPLPEDGFHFHPETTSDRNGNHVLSLEYMGSPHAAGEMLKALSKLTKPCKHARFGMKLTSIDPFPKDIIAQLKSESQRIRQESMIEDD